jgi:deoxyribodipyrimidine photo-lyase
VNYTLCLLRFDLRLKDNLLIEKAIDLKKSTIFLYIFDEDEKPKIGGASKWWLHHSLSSFQNDLNEKLDSKLILKKGNVIEILKHFLKKYSIENLIHSEGFGEYLVNLDSKIADFCEKEKISLHKINNACLLNYDEIKKEDGSFYKVFTPFWKNFVLKNSDYIRRSEYYLKNLKCAKVSSSETEDLESWNLLPTRPNWAKNFDWKIAESEALSKWKNFTKERIYEYKEKRNFPWCDGVSKLSPHFAFGEIAPWRIFHDCQEILKNDLNASQIESINCFLSEIGWREFSYYLLKFNLQLQTKNFNARFDNFEWSWNSEFFERWQAGATGYPIVDASMKQLWETGWMHNRCRMIVGSFLTKNLLIDWRFGEKYFWDTLVDANIASNSASWQWVSGSGADASPYFRIFNMKLQSEKFDEDCIFIKKFLPQLEKYDANDIHDANLNEKRYFKPIVDLKISSKDALERYKKIKNSEK